MTLLSLGRKIGKKCMELNNTCATVLLGSVAIGCADKQSDIDILVVCKPYIPSKEKRKAFYNNINNISSVEMCKTDPAWESVFSATDVLKIGSIPVDLSYQTEACLRRVIYQIVEKGALTTEEFPMHPWNIATIVGKESIVISDPDGIIQHFRNQLYPCSELFRQNLVKEYLSALDSVTRDILNLSERHIGPNAFLFLLLRALNYFVPIIEVINGSYPSPTKRVEQRLAKMKKGPKDFSIRLIDLLRGPFDYQGMRKASHKFAELVNELRELPELKLLLCRQRKV